MALFQTRRVSLASLNENELLPSVQSAYRQFFSTETAVLKVVSDVLTAMDRGQITLLVPHLIGSCFCAQPIGLL